MALSGELYDYMNVRNFAFGNARKGRAALNSLAVANEAAYCEVLKVLAGIDSSQSTMAALLNDAESIKAIALSRDAAKCVAVTGRAFDVISAEGSAYRAMVAGLADSLEETPWRLLSGLSRMTEHEIDAFDQLVGKTKTADFGKWGILPCRIVGSFHDRGADGSVRPLTFQSDTIIYGSSTDCDTQIGELDSATAVFDYTTVYSSAVSELLPYGLREVIRPALKWTFARDKTNQEVTEMRCEYVLFALSQAEINQGSNLMNNGGTLKSDSVNNKAYSFYKNLPSSDRTGYIKKNASGTASDWIVRGTVTIPKTGVRANPGIKADGSFVYTNAGKNFVPAFCI